MAEEVTQARTMFSCHCSVCTQQTSALFAVHPPLQPATSEYRSYTWLLEQLGEASQNTPLALNIPDTVVYRQAKAQWSLVQGKDGFLKFSRGVQKNSDVRIEISHISANRKKEDATADSNLLGKETALVQFMKTNNTSFRTEDEEGAFRVMLDTEFMNFMDERSGSAVWKRVNYIQSILKCKHGLANTNVVTYNSHDLAQLNDISETLQFCQRIARCLEQHQHKKLTRITAEFMTDATGSLWLLSANQILTTDIPQLTIIMQKKHKYGFSRAEVAGLEVPRTMHLPRHQLRVKQFMDSHYSILRLREGIQNLLSSEEPSETLPESKSRKLSRVSRSQTTLSKSRQTPSTGQCEMPEPGRTVKDLRMWAYHPKVRVRPIVRFTTVKNVVQPFVVKRVVC